MQRMKTLKKRGVTQFRAINETGLTDRRKRESITLERAVNIPNDREKPGGS